MYAVPISPQSVRTTHFFTHWLVGVFAAALLALFSLTAHAATPAAGASISNQASASYSDASGVARNETSNVVSTTVTQVTSMTLTANGAQNATSGSIVYYPHTLTNTGNGTDTFNLTSSNSGAFTMTGVQYFADNGSGAPTGSAITSTGPIAAGASFRFIAVGTLPAAATAGQTNAIVVTGTSTFTPAITASNTDTTTVTTNAVVTVTKAITGVTSGIPGTTTTYQLSYTNTGNSTATAVAITDVIPTGLTYVPGSGRWSATGATPLNNTTTATSVGTAPNTLSSSLTGNTFVATLNQVIAGQSGTISFQVTVNAGVAPGTLNNTATTSYNNGATTVTGTSGTVPFTVTQVGNVSIDSQNFTPSPAAPGATVTVTNTVTNTGTGSDSFNIVVGTPVGFPAGTTFTLYQPGGLTPLVDTNGDGIPDTGPVAAGVAYAVVVKATLPPNAPTTAVAMTVPVTATSKFDPTKTATGTDTLGAITGASVDLTNNTAGVGAPGFGNPNAALAVTNFVNPGLTTTFTLVTSNTGPSPDSYNLAVSTNSTLATTVLPAGWTVVFKQSVGGVCTTTGATVTNTGSVASSGSVTVCAVVTVPAGFAAGLSDLYFRALSPTSAVSDILHDAVTVNAVRSLSITPNGAGQTYPGGSFVYTHTLINTGNVLEGDNVVSTVNLPVANNQSGYTSLLYYDTNGNGVLDAGDALITGTLNAVRAGGLAAGASITVFDKVIAPSGAVPGAVNVSTITVTTTNNSYTTTVPAPTVATDSTTVIAGNLTLEKTQALQAGCTGAVGAFTNGNLSAKPGDCVLYQIKVTNVGAADATSVVVSDATPTYTTLFTAPATSSGQIATGAPVVGGTGSFSANVGTGATASVGGTLAAAQSATLSFAVKINP